MLSINEWVQVILIGVGATIFMDIWGLVQKAMGAATLNYAMVGRWAGRTLTPGDTLSGAGAMPWMNIRCQRRRPRSHQGRRSSASRSGAST